MVTRYAVIENGVVTNVVLWDGTSSWTPPQGAELVPYDPVAHVISVSPDVANRRSLQEVLETAVTYFGGNYANWSNMNNAQKDAAAKNGQRALAQIARWLLGQFDATE